MNLLVKLGADISEFLQAFNNAEGEMKAWGKKMQDIGGKLSIGVTAPLTLAGGSALKMAADMEQAAISFEVLTKSAENGKRVLGELQKFAADTPFEFPEVQEGAKQLLAYGFSIEHLTPLLRKAGDLASGMSVPITEVTRVLGRLKAGDFGEAFERLRDFGISRPDLEGQGLKFDKSGSYKGSVNDALTAVSRIIDAKFKGMTEKQAQSAKGLFATATDSVGMFAANIGQKLIDAFDLKGKLKGFISGMDTVSNWFDKLSPQVQKTIFIMAGLAAAIGPVAVGIGTLSATVIPMLVSGLGSIKTALLALTSPIGVTIAALAVLTAGFVSLYNTYHPSIQTAKQLTDVTKQVTEATGAEIAKLQQAIAVAGSDKKSKEERVKALNQLKAQYPDYFGKMDIEKLKAGELKTAYDKLAVSILNAAYARAQEANLQKLISQQEEERKVVADRRKEIKDLIADSKELSNIDIAMGGPAGTGTQAPIDVAAKKLKNAKTQAYETQKAIELTTKSIAKLTQGDAAAKDGSIDFGGYTGGRTDDGGSEKAAKDAAKFLQDQIKDMEKLRQIQADLQASTLTSEYRRKEQGIFNDYLKKELEIKGLNVSEDHKQLALADLKNARQRELVDLREKELQMMKPTAVRGGFGGSVLGPDLKKRAEAIGDAWNKAMAAVQPGIERTREFVGYQLDYFRSLGSFGELIAQIYERSGRSILEVSDITKVGITSMFELTNGLLSGLQQGFQSLFETGKFSFKGIAQALTGMISKLTAAAAVAFLLNQALGGTGLKLGGVMLGGKEGFAKLFSGFLGGGFKTGGIADGPSSGYLALLHGREVITPYNQAEKMLSGGNNSSGQSQTINLVVDGQVLASINTRANNNNDRVR